MTRQNLGTSTNLKRNGITAFAFVIVAGLCNICSALVTVSIGNGVTAPDGSYLNAASVADTLAFTNVAVNATNQISVVDPIDISVSGFWGPTLFNLNLTAPTFNLNNNLIMGGGNVIFTGNTANLSGRMTTAFPILLGPGRVQSNATTFNVLANTASVQQAIDFSAATAGVTINVSTGQYPENVTINKSLALATSNVAGHANGAHLKIANASATATATGSAFSNATSGRVSGIGTLNVSGIAGGLLNHGTVAPGLSPGIISITGAYNQASDGTLEIEIGGTTVGTLYDRLAVSGASALDGFLQVNLINSYVPTPADAFTILTTSTRTGTFSNAPTYINTGGGFFNVSYTPTAVVLSNYQVPEPTTTLSLCAATMTLLTRRRHR
jgi:hypothetical protein